MEQKKVSLFNLAVIVGALGYFVDVYDLLLFSIIRIPSLHGLGLTDAEVKLKGTDILSIQMYGLLIGGILWGVLGDKLGGCGYCLHRSSCTRWGASGMALCIRSVNMSGRALLPDWG